MTSAAQQFLDAFMPNRTINRAFYSRMPKDRLDFRMVETADRRSDSPRESLAHHIYVTKKYVYAAKHGVLAFDGIVDEPLAHPETLTKAQLLAAFDESQQELFQVLSDPLVESKMVRVPWSSEPVSVIAMLQGLNAHEILHEGWNLALMDHLNIERFPEIKAIWG